ncbi:MAG TPA: 30S ribosomal protein S2, partial [Candidatus Didemnitutus sp.]|nr:30S ribosomal protein S2 [Candidatus Didemnitutus sp.]
SLAKFKKYQTMDANGELAKFSSKEESAIRREMARMTRNFDGIANITGLPGAVFVVDTSYEEIAVAEAKRMRIPSIGLVDTNSDPTQLAYPIPGNDDATKSIRIVVDAVVAAIQSGLNQRQNRGTAQTSDKDAEAAAASAEVAAPAETKGDENGNGNGGEKPAAAARKRTARAGAAKKSAVSTEDV